MYIHVKLCLTEVPNLASSKTHVYQYCNNPVLITQYCNNPMIIGQLYQTSLSAVTSPTSAAAIFSVCFSFLGGGSSSLTGFGGSVNFHRVSTHLCRPKA